MRKIIAGAATALLIAGGLSLATASAASATPQDDCIPVAAWTETIIETPGVPGVDAVDEVSHLEYQRYSWTGGKHADPQGSTPPGKNWQANTTNYKGGDPVGVAFEQGGGYGSWFFWTVEKVVTTPAVPAIPPVAEVTRDVEHAAIECDAPVAPEPEPVAAKLALTYIQDCEGDTTNTWRIRNGEAFPVKASLTQYGGDIFWEDQLEPGDTIVEVPRTSQTVTLNWQAPGIIPGSATKASGNDIECAPVIPIEPEEPVTPTPEPEEPVTPTPIEEPAAEAPATEEPAAEAPATEEPKAVQARLATAGLAETGGLAPWGVAGGALALLAAGLAAAIAARRQRA